MEAAERNYAKLQQRQFDLESILRTRDKSILSYGSEFKSTSELEALLFRHPRWKALKERLENGAKFPIDDISERQRVGDLTGRLARGNHKSAQDHQDFLAAALKKEIAKGWLLPLPASRAEEIPQLEMAPMGVAVHLGIDANGEYVSKERITHDLSFPGAATGESINSRVQVNELEPCMFGHMLSRLVHHIVHLRQQVPGKRIWIRKEDFKSAYRRLHLSAITAWKSVVRMEIDNQDLILVSLRLPFGGAPCPPDFCIVSDVITDTINDLLIDDSWDHETVRSDFINTIPGEIPLPDHIPFEPARDMSVDLPSELKGKADVYIDDVISCTVDVGNNLERLKAAACTVIHAFAHNTEGPTYLERQDFISLEKNKAEGAPEEKKTCLGWDIDTRKLLISLPKHKFLAWDKEIQDVIQSKTVSNDRLLSLLGRLENVAVVVTPLGHFLNNIRSLQLKAEEKRHNVLITNMAREDLKLTRKFLLKARKGVNMNLMTFRTPDLVFIGDASEHGMGGFDSTGRAWRYLIPTQLRGRAHINLLEFLTQVIGIWLAIEEGRLKPLDCVLAMGDSTTALGWLRRSNFRGKDEDSQDWRAKQKAARKLGEMILHSNTLLYRQWFRGKENVVADSLSRDLYYLSSATHTRFLHLSAPSQLPDNFQIQPLPDRISSFITSVLQPLPVLKQRSIPQSPSDLALGNTGILSYILSDLKHPCSSMDVKTSRKILSCLPLPKPLEKELSLQEITSTWWKEQSVPPYHMWLRPSGQTTGLTPDWTQMAKHVSC